MDKNEKLKILEQLYIEDTDIIDEYYENERKKNIVLPNLYFANESKSFYLQEDLFAMYFDNIIAKTFDKNINNICLFTSKYVSDYFIEIDFFNFKYKISKRLINSLENCKENINIRFYIIPFKLIFNYTDDAHSNIIIIDNQEKRIEFFEPHGYYQGSNIPYDIETYIKQFISLSFFPIVTEYQFVNVQQSCPIGLQSKQSMVNPESGHCLAWSLLFINTRLNNLTLSSEDIINYYHNQFDNYELDIYIRRFIGFLETNNQIVTKHFPNTEYTIQLSEIDKQRTTERISELVKQYLYAKSENERENIIKDLTSYHNFPKFNELFFYNINKYNLLKQKRINPKRQRKVKSILKQDSLFNRT